MRLLSSITMRELESKNRVVMAPMRVGMRLASPQYSLAVEDLRLPQFVDDLFWSVRFPAHEKAPLFNQSKYNILLDRFLGCRYIRVS